MKPTNMNETTIKTIQLGNFSVVHTYENGGYQHSYLITDSRDEAIGGNAPTYLGSSPLHIQALIEALKGGIEL